MPALSKEERTLRVLLNFNKQGGEQIVSKLQADGVESILKKLHEVCKWEVKGRTGSETCGQSALHEAAKLGELDTLSVLLLPEVGVELNAPDNHGATALHQAAMHGQVEAAEKLLKVAKERNLQLGAFIRATDCNKQTPLHYAAKGPDDRSGGHGDREVVINLLLKHDACPEMQCDCKKQPLQAAARAINMPAVTEEV